MEKTLNHPYVLGLIWILALVGGLTFLLQSLGINAFGWWSSSLGSYVNIMYFLIGLAILIGTVWKGKK